MNLLEHYIEEIHNQEKNEDVIKVDITTLCYGRIERSTYVFPTTLWLEIKSNGYFMA